jgi:acetyl esterase/lipase
MATIDYKQQLHPQMSEVLEKQAEIVPGARKVHELDANDARRQYARGRQYWNADAPEVAEIIESRVEGPAGSIPVRVYLPNGQRPLPALIYLHGGGWVVGNLDTHDKIMRLLALRSGAAVIGVDYRLAPEHKFPTAIGECCAVVAHVRDHGADWGVDARRIAIGGDSAGANLAVAVALELRETEPTLLSLLVLVYGVFGLRDSASRRLFGQRTDSFSNKDMDYYYECYMRGPEDQHDERLNVLAADLRGLPPAIIAAAGMDLLLDDNIAMHELLVAADVPSSLKIYDGVLHGFLHYSRTLDAAGAAIDDTAAAMRSAFERAG